MVQKRNLLNIKSIISVSTFLLLIILLCFPRSSLKGAERGIVLWFNVICPTLLPFMVVSNLIINLNLTSFISNLFYPIFHRLFAVTKHGCYVSVVGLLTGLPVGAKASNDLVCKHLITKKEGQYLLTFCNNASPMFVISYVSITTLNLPGQKYIFLLLIYLSGFLTAFTYRFLHKIKCNTPTFKLENKHSLISAAELSAPAKTRKVTFAMVDNAIVSAFDVLTKVGGYIILFSILASVLLSIAPANHILSYFSVGMLEITNGVNCIGTSALDMNIKIALILSLTSFGGFSSVAQTKSVIDESGLSIKIYLLYKLLNAAYTFLLISMYLKLCMF